MKKAYTTVLTIAGSDTSGGAGIQADIKTFSALECYGLSVITALTAQNTTGVTAVYPLDRTCITSQFRAITGDIQVDAVKIGMLCNAEIITTVSSLLKELPGSLPIILDTVLGSSSGTTFLTAEAVSIMIEELFPLATLITPNLLETALLTGLKQPPDTPEAIEHAALKLLETGAASVLVKGGHGTGDLCSDCLCRENRFFWFSSEKINTDNTHGTGCTLSSAIAAFMARGETVEHSAEKAKIYVTEALRAGSIYHLGNGAGPLHHLWQLWK